MFLNEQQTEFAAFSWPRIISPPQTEKNLVYLNLCLPEKPAHAMPPSENDGM